MRRITLTALGRLRDAGVKITPLAVAAGLSGNGFSVRMLRGSPDLTPAESDAVRLELRRLRDDITREIRRWHPALFSPLFADDARYDAPTGVRGYNFAPNRSKKNLHLIGHCCMFVHGH